MAYNTMKTRNGFDQVHLSTDADCNTLSVDKRAFTDSAKNKMTLMHGYAVSEGVENITKWLNI